MRQEAIALARERRDAYLEQLLEGLSIPSVSTLPEHGGDVQRMAEWLAADLRRIGLRGVRLIATAGNPVVYGEWLDAGTDAPTVIIYGHYDVQPPDPIELWESDPFRPEIRNGAVYARGASDNKAQHFAHMKAIETILRADGRLPVNVKFVLDGEEEVGSPNIDAFVAEHRELLAADSGIISDGAMISRGQPSLDYGVRGVVALEIRVRGPGRDLHSGSYGGTVYNPAQVLSEMIAALHDQGGRVTIPGFYDAVRPLDKEERERLAAVPYPLAQWQEETGATLPWGEGEYTLLERIAARPTCEVNGLWSGFQGAGVKTIIPATAGAKISLRLVPDQEPEEVARAFEGYIREIAPPHVDVEVMHQGGCRPALMPIDSVEIEAATAACEAVWGRRPVLSRGGGSLPVIAAFQHTLGAPFVLMPFGLDDNRHSPNEHFLLENFERGVEVAVHYYYNLGGD